MTEYKILIAGASGLIGSALLNQALQHHNIVQITLLVRKQIAVEHSKLKQVIVDFDRLDKYQEHITGDAVFCCLGTTRRKTPDVNLYRQIDHDYPLKLAQISMNNKVKQYHFVSSIGADPTSKGFYTKIKGETEADLQKIPLSSLLIYRPSLLTGTRKEIRLDSLLGGPFMKIINPFLTGKWKNYRSIPAEVVAAAMLNLLSSNLLEVSIYSSERIKEIAINK